MRSPEVRVLEDAVDYLGWLAEHFTDRAAEATQRARELRSQADILSAVLKALSRGSHDPRPSRDRPKDVYFIQCERTGEIKIGITANIAQRILNLRSERGGAPLQVLKTIPGDRPKEIELHKKFSAYRIKGEWFKPAPELLRFIQGAS